MTIETEVKIMSPIKAKVWLSGLILLVFGIGSVGQISAQTVRNQRGVERQTRELLQRIRVNSDNFRASFDTAIQNVRLRGTESDNINRYIDDYESAVNAYDNHLQSRQDNVSDVKQILDAASKISGWLRTTRLGGGVNRDWTTLKLSLTQLARQYNLNWNGDSYGSTSNYPNNYPSPNYPSNNYPNGNSGDSNSRLNGTFQLDQSRSDNAADIATRAINNLPDNQRENARTTLEQRLETPDRLAIDQRGRQFTLASSRAPRYTFNADGLDKYETGDNNSNLRVRASLISDRLEVATSTGRGNDYNVIFEPLDNGRTLRVTRRLSADFLRQPVVVTSIYERTATIAQLDIYENPNVDPMNQPRDQNGYPTNNRNGSTTGFIITNDTKLQATLNEALSTKTVNNNDRFSMTVQTPDEYRGAVIEGYLSGINRSGKVTGRATLNFNFETIRLRDGRTYDFSGFVETIRNNGGDEIKVDNEGRAQGGNQTKQTATRGAVGAGLGALIGAIAGGGKGAAIGAIIGGGAGAGSVYIEGRDDLEINAGSEIYIRATAPNRSPR
jgi:hypothetical protein